MNRLALFEFVRRAQLASDGPDEAGQFARQGRHHHAGLFAMCTQNFVALMQSLLSLPAEVAYDFGLLLLPHSQLRADFGRQPILPRRFGQDAPAGAVAAFGDAALKGSVLTIYTNCVESEN